MIALVHPTQAHEAQVLAYRAEFLQNGDSLDGTGGLQNYEAYDDWLTAVRRNESEATVLGGLVPATLYLGVRSEDGRVVGMIDIRHRLNEHLLKRGGHIGYSVRPDERRKGIATRMLRLALDKCPALGIERALVTCDAGNEASRRVILACGGVLENEVTKDDGNVTRRFWIDLRWRVRPAVPDDAHAICQINQDALGYDYPEADTRARLMEVLSSGRDRVFVGLDGEAVRGYIHAADYTVTYMNPLKNILALAVDQDAQGQGLGRVLLNAAELWARQDGCAGVRLVSGFGRDGAHAFYVSNGYTMRKEQKNFVKFW